MENWQNFVIYRHWWCIMQWTCQTQNSMDANSLNAVYYFLEEPAAVVCPFLIKDEAFNCSSGLERSIGVHGFGSKLIVYANAFLFKLTSH